MIKPVKNIGIGLLLSFVGSLPLGWLNLVGFEVYRSSDLAGLMAFLFGVVLIEAVVIYVTLAFAREIAKHQNALRYIELFSIAFLLALVFFSMFEAQKGTDLTRYLGLTPFMAGLICSAVNFIQIPFWLGWNLYLSGNNYIHRGNFMDMMYVTGCLLGTGSGMTCIILTVDSVAEYAGDAQVPFVKWLLPALFFAMAVFQFISYRKKHLRKQVK